MTKILPCRRCGNTTRQVDEWVQELFTNGYCIVIDHAHKDGNVANRHALDVLGARLHIEHGISRDHLVFSLHENKLSFKTPNIYTNDKEI